MSSAGARSCRNLHQAHRAPLTAPLLSAALLSGFFSLGCTPQPPLGKAVGRVTFRGAPVTAGAVIFSNEGEGAAYASHLQPDGSFRFEVAAGYGLPPGAYAVAIGPPQPKPSLEMELSPPESPGEFPAIPSHFWDPATSGLTAVVKEGDNVPFQYDLP